MDTTQTIVSVISGGLAGASVSAFSNRVFYWRALRTKFHPILNNIMGEYTNRFNKPDGRYWIGTVGYLPTPEDEAFVTHRTAFIHELPQYNELREARELQRVLIGNPNPSHIPMGMPITTDLMPEYKATLKCLGIVQKKLKF